MDKNTKERIEKLRQKLADYQVRLKTLTNQFLKIKEGNQQEIINKEKELEE